MHGRCRLIPRFRVIKHKDTKAQRHKESREIKVVVAGFLCVPVSLCFLHINLKKIST